MGKIHIKFYQKTIEKNKHTNHKKLFFYNIGWHNGINNMVDTFRKVFCSNFTQMICIIKIFIDKSRIRKIIKAVNMVIFIGQGITYTIHQI